LKDILNCYFLIPEEAERVEGVDVVPAVVVVVSIIVLIFVIDHIVNLN